MSLKKKTKSTTSSSSRSSILGFLLLCSVMALCWWAYERHTFRSSWGEGIQRQQYEAYLLDRYAQRGVSEHKDQLHRIRQDVWDDTHLHIQNDEQMLQEIRRRLSQIYRDIDQIEWYPGKKSYTINKQQIYLCLKDERGKFYHMNMLMYVALHELAHCLCDEVGHTPKFHAIFDSLLDVAHEQGIYNKTMSPISPYCEYEKEDDVHNT